MIFYFNIRLYKDKTKTKKNDISLGFNWFGLELDWVLCRVWVVIDRFRSSVWVLCRVLRVFFICSECALRAPF